MRSLTVLGSCGAWPEPGRACAGFLLEYDGYKVVLALPHYVTNLGIKLTAPGLSVAYTGDSGPSPLLPTLAEGTDLFISDATLQGPSPTSTPRYVMTAAEAATGAAGAQTLLLTHFWPGSDRSVSVTEAQKVFAGEVIAAEEGLVLTL
jgi:ribonuclease BN (tRNA processing enzyme)